MSEIGITIQHEFFEQGEQCSHPSRISEKVYPGETVEDLVKRVLHYNIKHKCDYGDRIVIQIIKD